MKESFICCICHKEITDEYGCDPWPISTKEGEQCCEECNLNVVVPKRLEQMLKSKLDSEA